MIAAVNKKILLEWFVYKQEMFGRTVQPFYAGVGPCYVAIQFVFTSLRTSSCVFMLTQACISIDTWLLANGNTKMTILELTSAHSNLIPHMRL
jgi:hypothetical protein